MKKISLLLIASFLVLTTSGSYAYFTYIYEEDEPSTEQPCLLGMYYIARQALVLVAPRTDGRVQARAWDLGEAGDFPADAPTRRGTWLDYVQAAFFVLAEQGEESRGFDLAITSRVPPGAGLSSSAALGVCLLYTSDAADE